MSGGGAGGPTVDLGEHLTQQVHLLAGAIADLRKARNERKRTDNRHG
jgi:hypothetical protein